MKKVILFCGMVLLLGTFSSFKATTFTTKQIHQKAFKYQTQVAGYFTKYGVDYEVWVCYQPDGWAYVTDVLDVTHSNAHVDYFLGQIDYDGITHLSVENGSTSFYFVGYLRSAL
jgi:hypothetical protein